MPANGRQPGEPSPTSDALDAPHPQRESAQRAKCIVPWLIAFAVHALLVFLGSVFTWTVVLLRSDGEGTLVVAQADVVAFEPVVVVTDETADAEEVSVDPFDLMPSDAPAEDLFVDLDPAPVDLAPETPVSGNPSSFAAPSMPDSVSFMGLTSVDAQRIVYVIDASGRMISTMQIVIQELARSLESLGPHQEFAIVFIQREQALIVPPRRPIPAGPRERRRALEWIERNVVPAESANPIAAFEAAMQMNPDVIFVLSGNITGAGIYEVDQEHLLNRLDQLNPPDRRTGERRTRIQCIQFLDHDPLDTLRLAAEEHGGPNAYKFLSRRELGLSSP